MLRQYGCLSCEARVLTDLLDTKAVICCSFFFPGGRITAGHLQSLICRRVKGTLTAMSDAVFIRCRRPLWIFSRFSPRAASGYAVFLV